jgi:type II secretory pathway pseudopilin PulG
MRLKSCQLSEESRQLSAVSSQPERRTAFTIVELVVVLMIMSILGATAIPSFYRSLQQQRLETAARRLKQDLELVRQTARNKSKTESLSFTSATAYTLSADVQGLDHTSQTYAVDLSAAPYNVSAISISNLGVPAKVTFDGYGTIIFPSPTATGTVVMQMGSYKRVVTVTPSTGQVVITNN